MDDANAKKEKYNKDKAKPSENSDENRKGECYYYEQPRNGIGK